MNISKSLIPKRVQNYWYRQGLIKYFFVLFLLLFGFRIVTIHELDAGEISLQEKGNRQAVNSIQSKARRGDILDRNNHVLASNLILKKVNLDPTQVQSAFIPKLAKALMMPEQSLHDAINAKLSKKAGRRYLLIKKNLKLTDPIIENIKILKQEKMRICRTKSVKNKPSLWQKSLILANLKPAQNSHKDITKCRREIIQGVALQADSLRYYPKSAALAPLLGRVNNDKKGVSGIEGEFESVLSGQNGDVELNFTANDARSYFNPITQKPLKHGQDIVLTIDSNVQFHAYMAIKNSVEKHEADSGSAVILSPNGEILAMVNYPAEDPNDKQIYNAKNYRNHVLSDKVEPGSTMKPFTMLLALDKHKITATNDESIDVTKRIGHIKPDGKYKQMTVKKILQKSHNLGTVNVAQRLKKQDFYDAWYKLGFGQPLGLIPSIENSGSLKHFGAWSNADKYTLSFGHGPMETNLAQLARAYLVFANEGAIPNLKLIKNANTTTGMTQVFSPQSTSKIATLLGAVVSNKGSGYRAQIRGYDVAGKTGTAELVVNGAYSKNGKKRTFFTGFVPVQQPKYIMAVRLDYPKKCYTSWNVNLRNKCEGSNSAAMVFKEAMENILGSDMSIELSMKN